MKGYKLAGIQIAILLLFWLLPQLVSAQIVINEIMYDPSTTQGTDANQEWLELFNTTDQEQNVGGWTFGDASGATFTLPGGTTIPANGYLILAINNTEFTNFYTSATPQFPIPEGVQVLDWGSFNLNNDGAYPVDTLTLKNASGTVKDQVSYDDGGSWPTGPDGNGPSLEKINPSTANTNTNADASNWAASTVNYGTPGRINTVTPEPSTIALFATGLFLGLWYRSRLRKRAKGERGQE